MSINNLHFIRLLLKKTEICRQKSPAAEFVGTFYSRFWDFLLWGGAYRRWIAQILRNDTGVVPYGLRFAVAIVQISRADEGAGVQWTPLSEA